MVKTTRASQIAVTAAAVLSLLPSATYAHAHEGVGFHVPLEERQENEPYFKALRERFGPAYARVDIPENGLQRRQQATATATSNAAPGAATTSGVSMGTIPIGVTTTPEVTSPLPTTYAAGATAPVSGAPVLPAGE